MLLLSAPLTYVGAEVTYNMRSVRILQHFFLFLEDGRCDMNLQISRD